MSNERNSNAFWKNVLTGVGIAAAGASLAYFVNEIFKEEEAERGHSWMFVYRKMWPFALQLLKTAAIAAIAAGVTYYVYRTQQSWEEAHHRSEGFERRGRRGESSSSELRTRIIDKLNSGTYECNICLEEISRHSKVVSCKNCYTINHLKCIKQHCNASEECGKSRECPSCRTHITYELQYYCFCGMEFNPKPREGGIPHSCQSRCTNDNCSLRCHPGPCYESS